MKRLYPLLKLLLLSLVIVKFQYVKSQDLLKSRQSSYYTYIYKITEIEAKKIYKKDVWAVDSTFFHTLIDSFPTDSNYQKSLEQGHYIKTFALKNKQQISITSIQKLDVFLLNNNTDLSVQIYDLDGEIIDNAEVWKGLKKLRYNKKRKVYIDKKSNRKGLLKVKHKGFTSYYNLEREYNNSTFKRTYKKVIYSKPLVYAWIPIRYVVRLPIDGVRSIIKGWAVGTISRTGYFFRKTYRKVACLFDNYHCDYNSNYKFKRKHSGYLVFNKPKYLPGDTVKFKAFLVTKKGKPINKEVEVTLYGNGKEILLTHLSPYRKGGYNYEFFLHDSLDLQLDRNYTITLRKDEEKEYIKEIFKYEDYELSKNELTLSTNEEEHYRDQQVSIFVKGTDENKLNLLDARLEILVSPTNVTKYFDEQVFVPDTLLFLKKQLAPQGETEIILSDSLFPKANFDYHVQVNMFTSDNEVVSESKSFKYYYENKQLSIEILTDSLLFSYRKNGQLENKEVMIYAEDNFGNEQKIHQGLTPIKLPINNYYALYTVKSDSLTSYMNLAQKPSLLQCFSERTKDSLYVVVDNPRNIPFNYNIYKRNKQKKAGHTTSLNLQQNERSKQNYFVSIQYLWGGEIKEENYRIPLVDKKLNIAVTQPKLVYPGQKSLIELSVTDIDGKPVEGVDLTAYALTKKFDYNSETLPYLGKNRKDKTLFNNFHFSNLDIGNHPGLSLNYAKWKKLTNIDSIPYYQFIYPKDSIYRFEYITKDTTTQFAPFVVERGGIQSVHVIYVDSKPIYFSWSSNANPYAFKIDSGYHQIKLRTTYQLITIDSLYFKPNKKLILGIDPTTKSGNMKVARMEPRLNENEKYFLYKYIFPYRNPFGERYAYLEQGGQIQLLNPKWANKQNNNFAGPIVGNATFHLMDSFSTSFYHESFYEYDFQPRLLKMRNVEEKYYPDALYTFNASKNLHDEALTKKALHEQWEAYLASKRRRIPRYQNPHSTGQNQGKLFLEFQNMPTADQEKPLNLLLFRYDDHEFLRVYPGNTSTYHALRHGYHQLLFFYPESKYHVIDSVMIQPYGINFYSIDYPTSFKKDSFSVFVNDLIEETLFQPKPNEYEKEDELKEIFNQYQREFSYTGPGRMVEGYVYAESGGEPLPGVSILVKGTTQGTVTNLDGYYQLKVPNGNHILAFSYIGFVTLETTISQNNQVTVNLMEDMQQLEEVIVIGYGVSTVKNFTASVSSSVVKGIPSISYNAVNDSLSNSLQGRVAGISISPNGGPIQISIRGNSSIKLEKTPLYVINGEVFLGDISELETKTIQSIDVLKGEAATSLYGARAANGVIVIEVDKSAFNTINRKTNKGAEYNATFLEAASQANAIRNNFSDYAFWQPKLITDAAGKASFEVTFPDDVTSWETHFLAMNGKKQSGQTQSEIKSYKPLIAQLALPRFLITGDTTFAIGKALNYLPDSVKVNTQFEMNGNKKQFGSRYLVNSMIDTLPLIAGKDALKVKYYLEKEDGYFDGEQREIPVFPIGLEETKGNFYVLEQDTSITLSLDTTLGKAVIYAKTQLLGVVEDEIDHVVNYKYLCNEQLASKLKAMIAAYHIAQFKGKAFKYDKDIKKVIKLLGRNQKISGLWGWWKNSADNQWITLHVLEALVKAEKIGFTTWYNTKKMTDYLIWELENTQSFNEKLRMLQILHTLETPLEYKRYIQNLEKNKSITLNGLLQLIELKQQLNLEYSLDTLTAFQDTTLFGSIYYDDNKTPFSLLTNDLQNTLLAYKIIRADSTSDKNTLNKIRNYFLEERQGGYWQNTYQSAQIIEAILPDLLNGKLELEAASLTIDGDIQKEINSFPFELTVEADSKLSIAKQGDFPVYLSAYQKFWNSQPIKKKNDFEITTKFNADTSNYLTAGKKTKLIVTVSNKKDAEYVMINIPIPGGCSYGEKGSYFYNESHREYFKNETAIFCERLSKGKHTFEVELVPRYSGNYTINPASISLMYFPTFSANNQIKRVKIE